MDWIRLCACRASLAALLIVLTGACPASAQDTVEVKPWQVFEVAMTATEQEANPYVAYLQEGSPARVTVHFREVSGEAADREIVVAGF